MDAQIDFLVKELTASYRQVHSLLMDSRVTWEAASDEVVYSFETPGAILGPPDPVTGRRQRLPRNNPSVQQVFMQRRTHAGRALNLYLQPTQETDFAFGEQEFGFGNETLSLGSGLRSGIESLMVRSAIRGGTTDENQLTNLILFRRHPERNGRAISRSEPDFQQVSQEWLRIRETIVRPILQGSHSNPSASPTPTQTPTPRPAPGQPPSTTSGVEAAGNTMRIINCITRLVDQGRPISFVVRYLRDLRRAEAAALSSAGIKIVSCYEARSSTGVSPTSMAYFTRAQGQHDGRRGFTQAQAVGQPAEKPVYFAVDTDPTVRQRQAILDYFQGVRDGYYQYLADMQAQGKRAVTYAIGVYGSGCVLDWSAAQGIVTLFWQAFAPGWCNNRRVWPGANIHTSGRDQPERCRWRLGRLEGWGNEGGW